jgi:putative ABC transport system permease protein
MPENLGAAFLARLAWRDLRSAWRGFVLFLACIALGVAAITAVGSLNASVVAAFTRDARTLMGGDLEIEVASQPLADGALASRLPEGASIAGIARLSSLLTSADSKRLPVSVKAVDASYPLLGEVSLSPRLSLAEALAGNRIVMEKAAFARLGVAVGDTVRLGDTEVEVAAVVEREPDRIGGLFSIGPRILMSQRLLAASGLLQPGSLVRYEYKVRLPSGSNTAAVAADLAAIAAAEGWRVQTSDQVQPRVARFTDRLATFLTLAGITALVIGGLGVALSVRTHLARRERTIAILKSVGASSRQILAIFLAQVGMLAGLGALLGTALGALLLLLLREVVTPLLPVRLEVALDPGACLLAASAGLLTALVFALRPLTLARDVPAGALFRANVGRTARIAWTDFLVMGLLALALASLAIVGVPRHDVAAWFVLAVAVSLLVLAVLARLLLLLLARFPTDLGIAGKLALGNLRAAGGGTAAVLVALGAGIATLTTTVLLQANLGREVANRLPNRAPALVFIDIQPAQRELFAAVLAASPGSRLLQQMPSLRARVTAIAGTPVEQAKVRPEVEWTLSRDRGLTYEATPPPGTELVAGRWWPADYAGPPLISIDEEIAKGYGVGLGDSLGFNVLGRTIEARIASIRPEIDWSSGRLDFLFIMSPGLLDKAPHTLIAAVDVPEAEEAALIGRVADAASNITPIPVRQAVQDAAQTLRKIGLAVDAVAAVTLVAGVLVLAAGVAAVRDRHRYQAVILKSLGATRGVLTRAFLLEYGGLGFLSALIGASLGTLAAWILVTRLMDLRWTFAPLPVAAMAFLAVVLALAAGATGLRRLLAQPVGPALRAA